jgi:TPP-dependent pyruvate/acetoin dehydrogenase alpha subunit
MVIARTLDAALVDLQRQGAIASHPSAHGEEAAILGAVAAMRDEDWVFGGPREAAAGLWRGMPISALAHAAFGSARAPGKGRNAPGMPFWKSANVASCSPLVGTHIPHAVGVAWAARARGDDRAALVLFGDGATSSGDFHAGLNFAGVARAPVVAVCRNNGFAMSTPLSKQTASAGLAVKAVAYGVAGVEVDGGDALAVLEAVTEARARASRGEGATLVEAVTTPGPSASHPERDPIARLRAVLMGASLWSDEREERLLAEASSDVEGAIAEARSAASPGRDTLFEDAYAMEPWHLREQRLADASASR